jgi:hypothetical protein
MYRFCRSSASATKWLLMRLANAPLKAACIFGIGSIRCFYPPCSAQANLLFRTLSVTSSIFGSQETWYVFCFSRQPDAVCFVAPDWTGQTLGRMYDLCCFVFRNVWLAAGQKRMGDAFLVVSLVVFLEDERIESVSPKSFFSVVLCCRLKSSLCRAKFLPSRALLR